MDCLQAQSAISDALDGATADQAVLDAAKQHCRDCEECAAFVRALNTVKRAPLPEPPADLADRVMAAVRAEAAAKGATYVSAPTPAPEAGTASTATTAQAAVNAQSGAAANTPTTAGDAKLSTIAARLKLARPGVLAAWAGAAALLLVGVGVMGVLGVRMMSTPPTASPTTLANATRDGAKSSQPQVQAAESAAGSVASSPTAASESSFLVFNGNAYSLVGPSTVQISTLTQLGITKSSLDGSDLRDRQVMGTNTGTSIYVLSDQGRLLEFKPVTRTYNGQTYQLKSGEVSAFGDWPVLPTDIAEPTASDGSPTFTAVGADSSGSTVYRLTSSADTKGIALAPGAPQGDPLAGSPNWSWWTLAP